MKATALKRARLAKGLSLRQLAEIAGLAHATIYDLEIGRRDGRQATYRALAKALDVDDPRTLMPDGNDA